LVALGQRRHGHEADGGWLRWRRLSPATHQGAPRRRQSEFNLVVFCLLQRTSGPMPVISITYIPAMIDVIDDVQPDARSVYRQLLENPGKGG